MILLGKIIRFINGLSPMHLITAFSLKQKRFVFKYVDVFVLCLLLCYWLLLKKCMFLFFGRFCKMESVKLGSGDKWLTWCQKAQTGFRITDISSANNLY